MPLSFGQRKRHPRQPPILVCTTAYLRPLVFFLYALAPSGDGAGRLSPEHVAGSRKLILRPDGWRHDLQARRRGHVRFKAVQVAEVEWQV